jgi:hypothetical protein
MRVEAGCRKGGTDKLVTERQIVLCILSTAISGFPLLSQ